MKWYITVVLAFIVTACGRGPACPQPVQQVTQPQPTCTHPR